MLQKFRCVLEFDVPYGSTVDAEDAKKELRKRIINRCYAVKIYVNTVREITEE